MQRMIIGRFSLGSLLSAAALAACGGPVAVDASDVSDATGDIARDAVTLPDATADVADASADVGVDVPVTTDVVDAGDAGCHFTRVIVGVSDYATFGGYVIGDLTTHALQFVPSPDAGSPVDQDHNLRASDVRCETYDLWHTSPSHVVTLDPSNPLAPRRTLALPDVPTGVDGGPASANPYDIAVISTTKAYVIQYNSPNVLIVDPSMATITGSISLAPLTDSDGVPEAASIAVVGAHAYIALQQLDRNGGYTAPTHSHLAVIDTSTDQLVDVDPSTTVVDGITLSHGNPSGDMPHDATRLLVTSVGNYGDDSSAIDVINLASNTVIRTIDNVAFGGKPSSTTFVGATTAWATVDRATDGGTLHVIVAFDPVTGTIDTTPIAQSDTYAYGALRRDPNGNVWALGGDYNMGSIHVFGPTGTPLLATPFLTGSLNTTSMDFLP